MKNEALINMAKDAMNNAYTKYSNFKVGAALLGKSGKVYTGCNIENASFGATICAERTAIVKAISEGEREFQKIAIVSDCHEYTYPCGICRQVMAEFMYDGIIVLENSANEIVEIHVADMLPYRFEL
jgi:cytidine deaminase